MKYISYSMRVGLLMWDLYFEIIHENEVTFNTKVTGLETFPIKQYLINVGR